jgi:CRP/FNR family cyclic AMP-dependent transcriptional regulator
MRIQADSAILSVLQTVPLFTMLDERDLTDLARAASMSELAEGEPLFEEGDAAVDIMFVMTGSIRLTCDMGEGPDIVVGYVESGDILGEMAVIDPAPRSASARAAEASVVLHVPSKAFNEFLSQGHPVAQALLDGVRTMMTQRIRILNDRISALFLIDAEADAEGESQSMVVRLREIWATMRSGG